MGETLSQKPSGTQTGDHPRWNPNHKPYEEHPPAIIEVPPEAQKAVDLGTGQHFDEMRRREEHQRNHQQPA